MLMPRVPVIVAVVLAATADVVTVNEAELAPAATMTVLGTEALEELDDRLTTVPPLPAGPFKVTVPVDGLPPITDEGDNTSLVNAAASIVSVAV